MNEWFSKWVWKDWTSDAGIRASSLAAQGLWMQMLAVAAQHEPPGYVALNGVDVDEVGLLAKLTGTPAEEIKLLISELETNHVFSRDRNGTIYNRRMLKKECAARASRENGKKGGNPNLKKQPSSNLEKSRVNLDGKTDTQLNHCEQSGNKIQDNLDPTKHFLRARESESESESETKSLSSLSQATTTLNITVLDGQELTAMHLAVAAEAGLSKEGAMAEFVSWQRFNKKKKIKHPMAAWRGWLAKRHLNGHPHKVDAASGIWVSRDDPRWDEFSARWKEAHGGRPPPVDKRGGWMFA